VERFFRTLNFLIHRLAGTVNSNPLDRGDYDSEGNAIYTLEQLREVFSDILNIYHHRSMSNVGQSPKTVWETLLPKHQPRVFDPDFVRTLGGKAVKCTVNKGRVEIKGIAWHSPSLPELEMRLRKDGAKALVHYDPCDLTYAWVRHPNEPESVIRCDPCDPVYQTGMTMKLHGEIRREARRIEAETGNEARMHMLKAAFIIKALEDANSSKGRSRQTKRARAEYHDHIQKAAAVMNDVVLNITPHEPNPMALPTAGQNMDTQAPDIGLSWADVPDIAHRPTDLPTAPSSGLDWADVPSC
jgi:putative transposase